MTQQSTRCSGNKVRALGDAGAMVTLRFGLLVWKMECSGGYLQSILPGLQYYSPSCSALWPSSLEVSSSKGALPDPGPASQPSPGRGRQNPAHGLPLAFAKNKTPKYYKTTLWTSTASGAAPAGVNPTHWLLHGCSRMVVNRMCGAPGPALGHRVRFLDSLDPWGDFLGRVGAGLC